MGWCEEHLESGCVFGHDETLRERYCPERTGEKCTLVHVMLTVHRMPVEIRRRVIAALYPAYGIERNEAALAGRKTPRAPRER